MSKFSKNMPIKPSPSDNQNSFFLTADLGFGVFDDFPEKYSNQFFNVGVAEQLLSSLACGLSINGDKVFTASGSNIKLSYDGGSNFSEISVQTLRGDAQDVQSRAIYEAPDGTIYAGAGNMVVRSEDNGVTWEQVEIISDPATDSHLIIGGSSAPDVVTHISCNGDRLIVGTRHAVFISD